jgi:hypothetical protein
MTKLFKKKSACLQFVAFTGLSFFVCSVQAEAPNELSPDTPFMEEQGAQEIQEYWTPDKMIDAKPVDSTVVVDDFSQGAGVKEYLPEEANPGYAPGWAPGSGPQPGADDNVEITPDHPLYPEATGLEQPGHGSPPPSNPLNGPYGPFQRWTWFGSYLTYPTSVHGKLFFTMNGQDFVCSGTVIHRNTVLTTGHCNSDGNGAFATNRLFCPSYSTGGIRPIGCWTVANSKTSSNWHFSGDPDYDYACLVTRKNSDGDSIGDLTGWTGRGWNFPATQMEMTFGYPSEAPFPGDHIVTVAAPEWYEHHFRSGGQISKCIGNDSGLGLSGGAWILGMEHRSDGYPDTDAIAATDPGSQSVNGVTSHRRCLVNCVTPPTVNSGVFWQEWCSPPFRSTSASDESEDIIGVCLNNGGT